MKDKPTYIVTGATGGIGGEIVRALAARGNARIILPVRKLDAVKKFTDSLDCKDVEFIPIHIDLMNLESVDAAAKQILDLGYKIDGLINNAGIMPGEIMTTRDGNESSTQVNYIATKRFTEHLLPAIADNGSIVFTSSITRYIARSRQDWAKHALEFKGVGRRFITYGRSKRMLTSYARELGERPEISARNIRVNCSDPGIADTNIITMGNRVVDALSKVFFRPFIHSAAQGAHAAIRAFDAPVSGQIFTLKGQKKNNIR